MREDRAARAIYESSGHTNSESRFVPWDNLDDVSKQTFRLHARAALEAADGAVVTHNPQMLEPLIRQLCADSAMLRQMELYSVAENVDRAITALRVASPALCRIAKGEVDVFDEDLGEIVVAPMDGREAMSIAHFAAARMGGGQ